jgi:twitching motility protein PilJ
MQKNLFSIGLLPALGTVLALALLAGAAMLWLGMAAGSGDGESGRLGRLVALTQAARVELRGALASDADASMALARSRAEFDVLRGSIAGAPGASRAASELSADRELWRRLTGSLDSVLDAGAPLADIAAAKMRLLELAPELLATTANLVSALSPEDLAANQSALSRFELTVEELQQRLRVLTQEPVEESMQRLNDCEQVLGQVIRGLSGEDTSLGMVAVHGPDGTGELAEAKQLFAQARSEIGTIVGNGERLTAAAAAASDYDQAAESLLERYRSLVPSVSTTTVSSMPLLALLLAGTALAVLALMALFYFRMRGLGRIADSHAEQNERNQQAILRLLDELSSLADGDLTVQATVTEDITGAIADSINYAIEALRGLVTTINDSSILVDAASKQTEATARDLVRSSEGQAKQAAAASESTKQMAMSIEGVSGNAERCSDVARHAVAVAHKGGEAVRRTIEGMNTIRETIQDTSKRIKRLGESSQEIGNIVELIEEIAEQTNILALNASIEASRAGEASRGFAVVADEVQKLAERSTNATRKIEVLVSTIQSDTNEAVVSMERSTTDVVGGALLAENAGAALDEIEQVSHQIASLVQNISSSAREQTGVSLAITKNMEALRQISARATESTAATSGAISKLSELASQLRKTVSGFRLPDHTTGTGVLNPARVTESLLRGGQEASSASGRSSEIAEPPRRKSG